MQEITECKNYPRGLPAGRNFTCPNANIPPAGRKLIGSGHGFGWAIASLLNGEPFWGEWRSNEEVPGTRYQVSGARCQEGGIGTQCKGQGRLWRCLMSGYRSRKAGSKDLILAGNLGNPCNRWINFAAVWRQDN